ncbi:MAG: TraE/TraK family type IV conjugative transfer system protein, partial [Pseudomonadota bacterium]
MNYEQMNRTIVRLRRGLGILGLGALLMLTVNVLLAGKLYSQSNQVVLIPSTIKDGMVARGAVDKAYVEALAMDAVYAMYNTSPETVRYGRTSLERMTGPAERPAILDKYDRITDDAIERKISTVFFPRKMEMNFGTYEVVVEGDLATYLETTEI